MKDRPMGEPCKKQSLLDKFLGWVRSGEDLTQRLERMDHQHREVRHDIKNVETRLDLIKRLVTDMRDESPSWKRDNPSDARDV
jgi:hypothetical protein